MTWSRCVLLGPKEGLAWGQLGFRVSALRRMKGGPMLQVLELHRRSHWLASTVAGGAHQLLVRFWHSEFGHSTYLRNMCTETDITFLKIGSIFTHETSRLTPRIAGPCSRHTKIEFYFIVPCK
jgi:hypothetical protein